jgi:hypothetical protein
MSITNTTKENLKDGQQGPHQKTGGASIYNMNQNFNCNVQ